jgi:predicted metal-dependent phosphoesterase TrpH
MSSRIDLHLHSHHSDGLDSPAELVSQAVEANLDVIALTDHDTTRGWDEAYRACAGAGIGFIPGIEVSSHSTNATGRRISVHLLAYLPDPDHAELRTALDATRESRVTRAQRMVERLAKDFPISWQDVESGLKQGATIGRPAIADALVRLGIVPNRSDAFQSILSSRGPYYISEHNQDTVSAIGLIRAAGGVPVLAHPLAGWPLSADSSDLPHAEFEVLISAGLAGFEVDHRLVPVAARNWLRELALRHGLVVTGSSDFHGKLGKENRLGENLTAIDQLQLIVDQATGGVEPLLPR